jgi:hypothetical protein
MEEPFDSATARRYAVAILDGPGTTVLTGSAKDELLENEMTSGDALNVLRGGRIAARVHTPSGWKYWAETQRMGIEFSFRGQKREPAVEPNELVLESAWRNKR